MATATASLPTKPAKLEGPAGQIIRTLEGSGEFRRVVTNHAARIILEPHLGRSPYIEALWGILTCKGSASGLDKESASDWARETTNEIDRQVDRIRSRISASKGTA